MLRDHFAKLILEAVVERCSVKKLFLKFPNAVSSAYRISSKLKLLDLIKLYSQSFWL